MSEAVVLAFTAAIYPPGLAVAAAMLAGTPPLRRALAFLAGAAVCTLGVGFAAVAILRGSGAVAPDADPTPHAGIQLGLGVALLVASVVVARRQPGPEQPDEPERRDDGRHYVRIFGLGMLMYTPSITYLAALNAVARSDTGTAGLTVRVVVTAAIVLLCVEVPIVLYLVAPDRAKSLLDAATAWVHVHGRRLLVVVLGLVGAVLTVAGLVNLT